ncbi:site-specific DNA-methyltransferase (adenine-specific) [Synergistales bacterium]|nr:site-specific DNA-methyltransferase (adenine-specific) [Synergistales bacterium]
MSDGKVHIPPIKTQGIKSKLVPLIKDNVFIDDSITWIEPFMGSCVVGLNIAPRNAIFADINPHLVNFYNGLRTGEITSQSVFSFLQKQGVLLSEKGDKHYYYVRERFNTEHRPLDFLFLNRSCFNGMIRFNKSNDFNVPYGHRPNRFSKAYITKIVNQVSYFESMIRKNNWAFLCQPFEDTIAMSNANSFIYCDPPYIGRHVDYFDSWDEAQEAKLRKCLSASNAKFMLSTWDFNKYRSNQYIDLIWSDCSKITQEHFYFVGAKEANRNSMTEALLTNYSTREKVNITMPERVEYEQMTLTF